MKCRKKPVIVDDYQTSEAECAEDNEEIDHDPKYGIKYSEDEVVPITDLLSQSIPSDELPF